MTCLKIIVLYSIFLLTTCKCELLTFSIIHFNDFHARYEPISSLGGPCENSNCIGGFSRLYAEINELVKDRPNPIVLNAGDNFVGTLWYIIYGWNITQHFLNKLPLDALTIGNHEFDGGLSKLAEYLKRLSAPIVCSNIDESEEVDFQQLYNKSVVIQKGGKQIGIIGVILKKTKTLSITGELKFLDEISSVNAEASRLLNEEKVFTNIVLSHCGYETDLEIARNLTAKISIVVGGHTDTFLYTGKISPGPDKPSGPYPTVVTNIHNGNKVLVVQASAYTKYLGNLTVIYEEDGNLKEWFGNPIFLDQKIPQDDDMNQELLLWKKGVDRIGVQVIGETLKAMPNKPCRSNECTLGNFATDAMVYSNQAVAERGTWTYASVALIHAGGMRSGFKSGNITFHDLTATFPFQDTIDVCEIKGKHIQEILEKSVDNFHIQWPHLYQVSGIHVIFNISKPKGQRVEYLKICCQNCSSPMFENVNQEQYYRVILPGFLTNTKFNPLFMKYLKNKEVGQSDLDVYVNYLRNKSPLNGTIQGRIQIFT